MAYSRKTVTKGLDVTVPELEETFEFTSRIGNTDPKSPPYNDPGTVELKKRVKSAKYWYDVPLNAVPVLKKGWPAMPDYMDGRQYFLWWKNNFEEGPNGPILNNPYPKYDKLDYVQAHEGSRRYGA